MFVDIYERDHPGFKRLESSEDRDLLVWAHNEGYIQLEQLDSSHVYYTDTHLDIAKMWYNKFNKPTIAPGLILSDRKNEQSSNR